MRNKSDRKKKLIKERNRETWYKNQILRVKIKKKKKDSKQNI